MSPRPRPDRQPDYPKTPQAATSPDEIRHIELDQHHPQDHHMPQLPHHPQHMSVLPPQHDTHTKPEADEFPPHTNQPEPIKPEKKITRTGIEH
ncbi:hypothetical protein [Methanosphaerula palustris]|uniref:Uncharacterized protein n=1 Tax=Methanosphaerula palustris (strain ATCC BAA-1556 / DSM 19958 / E1-9c) TaxID=521011 RepID=B8GGM5_METPE|nr:hypothetical protein [Methanosphaerula palustris]ACL16280.1 conserved hypothetical protein [Methanosphaerula palustris E1-9c]